MTVHSVSPGIMWRPYEPAGSVFPSIFTSFDAVKIVFMFAPARHGHFVQSLKPRSERPYGTSCPQIFPRRSLPLEDDPRARVVDRDLDGADVLDDLGPLVVARRGECQPLSEGGAGPEKGQKRDRRDEDGDETSSTTSSRPRDLRLCAALAHAAKQGPGAPWYGLYCDGVSGGGQAGERAGRASASGGAPAPAQSEWGACSGRTSSRGGRGRCGRGFLPSRRRASGRRSGRESR